jgi:hypothetical protein
MATVGTNNLSISDIVKNLDSKGDIMPIVEVLHQNNRILDDITWEEGNLVMGNRTLVRTSLPPSVARVANQGTTPGASSTQPIDDTCAVFENQSVLDKIVAETGGKDKVPANRANEARAHIESLGQKLAATLMYGSAAVPEEFVGFMNRYNLTSALNGQQIIKAGGSGADNASILFVQWGKGKVMGIYPRGSVGGLQREDRGLVDIVDSTGPAGATFLGYREYFTWFCGLAIQDQRCVVRAPNIDVSNLVAQSSAADLIDLMIAMIETVPNPDAGGVFYMNRTVRKMFRIQEKDAVSAGGGLTYMNVAGRRTLSFDGYPVRIVDKMLNNEALVV